MNTIGIPCHEHGIPGYGDTDGRVMLVGISPGRNEVREGRPFVGESGRLLDALLKATGWSREQIYATNLVCTENREPTPNDIARCLPRLQREIDLYKPKIIMPLGKVATETFMPAKTFGQSRGAVIWQDNVLDSNHSAYIIATIHPAAILHGVTAFVHDIYRDFSKIKDVMQWESDGHHAAARVNYMVATSTAHAQEFIDDLFISRYIAVDIESAQGKDEDESLDPFMDALLCIAISDGHDRTLVIPAEYASGLNWRTSELNYTFHNGNFDVYAIRRFLNIELPIVNDTLLMSYNLDERTGVHTLKTLAREYLGAGFYEDEAHGQAKKLKGYDKVDKKVLYEYNAKDAAYTAQLAPLLYERMKADNVLWPYDNLMIPAANVFADIQTKGIRVDMERLNELEFTWFPRWLIAQKELSAHAIGYGAPAPFNPNSNPQLNRLVYDILGLKSPTGKRSKKTGALSLDKEVLQELKGTHPFIDELHAYRKLDHIIGNYMLPTRELVKLDGNLHATTKQHGTVTARTSYVKPALQTIPNPKYDKNEEFGEFRDIFVPEDDDHVIVEADYSKAELYWAAHLSGDVQMIADLASGDFHRRTAAQVFNKPEDTVTKWDRTSSKHVTFGKMYGRSSKALAKGELKCSIAQAEAFSRRWDLRYPQYIAWNREHRRIAQTVGELVSPTFRKRRFRLILEGDYEMLNQAVNFPIQNAASDTTMAALIKLHPLLKLYDSRPLIMIHDALVFSVHKKHLETVCALISKVMAEPQFPGWPAIEVELSVGPSWGRTKEYVVPVRELAHV